MFKNINKVIKILDKEKKKKFKFLIFLMFFAMLLETISIGSLLPVINYMFNVNMLASYNIDFNQYLLNFGISEKNIFTFLMALLIIIFFIKNIFMIAYYWIEAKFGYKVRYDLGVNLFKKYLNSKYSFHIENNSSNLITRIVQETGIYGGSVNHLLTLIVESLIIFGITVFLLFLRPQETSIVIIIGLFLSSSYYFVMKNLVLRLGRKRESRVKKNMKSLQQGLGAIKDIIIYKAQNYFINEFHKNSTKVADASFKMFFLNKMPRIWFEINIVVIVVLTILFLTAKNADINAILAVLGIYLVSFFRILNSVNKILVALQGIRYAQPIFDKFLEDSKDQDLFGKEKNLEENNKIIFEKEIKFENVSFGYLSSKQSVLNDINFTIKKNDVIGIVGETGTGKSTLIDLLIGLIEPNSGKIKVDGKNIYENIVSWKKKLGYVPQNLYLLDDSIKKNIAFGLHDNDISQKKVESSIDQSQLKEFLKNLKDSFETQVGERGVKISGGEKQRIGIARALYNNPEVIVFDEATSSLDLDTEKRILNILLELKKNKTIIIVTHRTSNLGICDKVFRVENSQVNQIK